MSRHHQDSKSFLTDQKTPPFLENAAVIAAGDKLTLIREAHVSHEGGAKVQFLLNLFSSGVSDEVLYFEITRTSHKEKCECKCKNKCQCKHECRCKDECKCKHECHCKHKCHCKNECKCKHKCHCKHECRCKDKCRCKHECRCKNKCHCNDNNDDVVVVSLTNGPQNLVSFGTLALDEANLTVSTVDTCVKEGNHTYRLIITNNSAEVVNIDYYSFNVLTGNDFHFFTSKSAQVYPSSSEPPIVVLCPGCSQNFDFCADVCEEGKVVLNASFNTASQVYNGQKLECNYDILRDGVSITNGVQVVFSAGPLNGLPGPVQGEECLSVSLVDKCAPKGKHEYRLVLGNGGTATFYVDFISFSATVLRNNHKHVHVCQEFPPLDSPNAINVPPLTRVEIELPVFVHQRDQAFVCFTLNIDSNTINGRNVRLNNILFDVQRSHDKCKGGSSVIGGIQTLLREGPSTFAINESEINTSFCFTDIHVPEGKVTYKLVFLNDSAVENENIDCFSFFVIS